MSRPIPSTALVALTLFAALASGCDEAADTAPDPVAEARVAALEAQLDDLRGLLDGAESQQSDLRARIDALESDAIDHIAQIRSLESREVIRDTLLKLSAVIDSGDPRLLAELVPIIADDFVMVAIDFGEGGQRDTLVFEGRDELMSGFGPILLEAQANLLPSAIRVDFADEAHATATFKFANSVRPPSALGEDVDEKVLLFAAITTEFRFEDGLWRLVHLELDHSLAYPGALGPTDDPNP